MPIPFFGFPYGFGYFNNISGTNPKDTGSKVIDPNRINENKILSKNYNKKQINCILKINTSKKSHQNIKNVINNEVKNKLNQLKIKHPEIINYDVYLQSVDENKSKIDNDNFYEPDLNNYSNNYNNLQENKEKFNNYYENCFNLETYQNNIFHHNKNNEDFNHFINNKIVNLLGNVSCCSNQFFCDIPDSNNNLIKSLVSKYLYDLYINTDLQNDFESNVFSLINLGIKIPLNLFNNQTREARAKIFCYLFYQNININKILELYDSTYFKEFQLEYNSEPETELFSNYDHTKTLLTLIYKQLELFNNYLKFKNNSFNIAKKDTEKFVFNFVLNKGKCKQKLKISKELMNMDINDLIDNISFEDLQSYLFFANVNYTETINSFNVNLLKDNKQYDVKVYDYEREVLFGKKLKSVNQNCRYLMNSFKEYISQMIINYQNVIITIKKDELESYYEQLKQILERDFLSLMEVKKFFNSQTIHKFFIKFISNEFLIQEIVRCSEFAPEIFDLSLFEDEFIFILKCLKENNKNDTKKNKINNSHNEWNIHDILNAISMFQSHILP